MGCNVFWPLRIIIVMGSMGVTMISIGKIIWHRLYVEIPMRHLLHISIGQLIMCVSAIMFAIWSIIAGEAGMK
jgi:hypothetical protein